MAAGAEALEQALEDQPLADEPVQRRQRGDAERTHEGDHRRTRQAVDQPAEPVHVPGARRVLGDAGLKEQRGLVAAVVRDMVDPGDQQQRAPGRLAAGAERHGGAEGGHDDADVLDGGVGEEPLDVALGHRVQDANRRGDRAAAHRDQAGPGAGRRREPEYGLSEAETAPTVKNTRIRAGSAMLPIQLARLAPSPP